MLHKYRVGRAYFMKNMFKKILMIGLICSLMASVPTLAGIQKNTDTVQTGITRDVDSRRGTYINFSNSGITNAGGGVIRISGVTTAHEVVDKIRMHLYLDRLDSDNRWTQVDDFDFTFLPEDVPNGDLSEATVSFEVYDQPSGYYYRVRGTHGVWKNGVVETQSTRTDGVMITDTP